MRPADLDFLPSRSSRPAERGLVWVLEDSPLEAEMARRALHPAHDIELFGDGAAILERLANGARPDVMVVDWQLPVVSGLDVCRMVRASFDETALPILMLTIQGHRSDVVEGFGCGANDYLVKPYDVAELLARVGTLVRTARLHRALAERVKQLMLAARIGTILTQGRDIPELARHCSEAIAASSPGLTSGVWLLQGEKLVLQGAFGEFAGLFQAELGPGSGLVGQVAIECTPIFLPNVAAKGAGARSVAELEPWLEAGAASLAVLPLNVESHAAGVLLAVGRVPLTDDAFQSLAALAGVIALGFERARSERERAALLDLEQRARAEAEAANRSKDEFLAIVSHELRTPLSAIAGWISMLRAGNVRGLDVARALETVERNVRAQTQLVDDLLDVGRIVSGNLALERAPVDLVQVLEAAVEGLRPAAEAHALTLDFESELEHASIFGDAARLRQIFANLLANSLKFTPAGGRSSVTLHRRAEQLVEVTVADTGRGIAADFLLHVFERFRQADSSTGRSEGGLGLGLSIVKHLVELHGGSVRAHSAGPGRGASFTVELPLLSDAPPVAEGAAPSSVPAPPNLAGLNLLLVEDDPDNRELFEILLTDAGARVRTAASAAEALDRLRAELPHVLISDIGLPGEDGLSLIRKVRALSAAGGGATPAIALTAYTRHQERSRVIEAGFNRHVSKPLDAELLFAAITDLAQR